MELSDARHYLRIDQSLLIVECAQHAVRQEEVHRAYTHACSRRDELKLALDTCIAGVSEEFRNSKDDSGKPYTGERIAFLLQGDPSVVTAKEALNRASKEVSLWLGIVDAMQSRRRMLSDLTSLTLQGMSGSVSNTMTNVPGNGNGYQLARRSLANARETRESSST